MRRIPRGFAGRGPCLLLLSGLLALVCGESWPTSSRNDLRYQIFEFSSGRAFTEALADEPMTVLFADFRDDRFGYFSASAPGLAENGGSVPGISGQFDTSSCTFNVEESSFDSEDFPKLQVGSVVRSACGFDAEVRSLYLKGAGGAAISEPAKRLYNFVIVLTDDQRWDTLWAMPLTEKLAESGVRFNNAYTTSAVCCPFRASLLAGGLLTHNTNVLTNNWPNGGVERFDDSTSLATVLGDLGYRTGLFGKYMNNMGNIAPRIPPGWTEFAAKIKNKRRPERSWSDFYVLQGSRWPEKSDLRRTSEGPESGHVVHVTTYSPYYVQERAMAFLDRVGQAPFFLYIAPRAPHDPATPAPEDENSFSEYEYRDRAYGESDLSDKPEWVRWEAKRFELWKKERGDLPRKTLQSLQAVDRLVGAVQEKLSRLGVLDDTIIFFTSDSGFHWLEHRLTNKGGPYEEAIRVPLVVSFPGSEPREDDHLIAVNLDIAATIFDLVGSDARTDGQSLVAHFALDAHGGRRELFFERFAGYSDPEVKASRRWRFSKEFGVPEAPEDLGVWPSASRFFAGLRVSEGGSEWKYVEHYSGERELYDLVSDPYEERSLHGEAAYGALMSRFSERLRDLKGLAITSVRAPSAVVGRPYRFAMKAEGGEAPYSWRIVTGRMPGLQTRRPLGPLLGELPEGLTIDRETGIIRGTPRAPGRWAFVVEVKDSSRTRRGGLPQVYYEHLAIEVAPEGEG